MRLVGPLISPGRKSVTRRVVRRLPDEGAVLRFRRGAQRGGSEHGGAGAEQRGNGQVACDAAEQLRRQQVYRLGAAYLTVSSRAVEADRSRHWSSSSAMHRSLASTAATQSAPSCSRDGG
jgi:hypothetical protein